MRIVFYGSSLLSSYWNGAATYYRGLLKALARRGYDVVFCEPNILDRQRHRDIDPPDWAEVRVYPAGRDGFEQALGHARGGDVVVKASGVGVFDSELERRVLEAAPEAAVTVYWDVDAPATLERLSADPEDPLRALLPRYDLVLTYGGGDTVVERFLALGARNCAPIYNALDPEEHFPVEPQPRFAADLAFLGNRLPDRETRVEEFFISPARHLPNTRFLLGGSGWEDKGVPANVRRLGHVSTRDHNALNVSALAVLNINRDSMARNGWSPPTRLFEVAGAGGCLITDAWAGIELFLEPDREVLVARDGGDVAEHLCWLDRARARGIGRRALHRLCNEHTYSRRAEQVDRLLRATRARKQQNGLSPDDSTATQPGDPRIVA